MSLPDLDPFTLRWLADDALSVIPRWERVVEVNPYYSDRRAHARNMIREARDTAKRLRGIATRMERR